MPGKKKGGKKKGGKGAKKVEPELTPEQEEHRGLVEEAERLKKLLKEESEDINVFQQQRVRGSEAVAHRRRRGGRGGGRNRRSITASPRRRAQSQLNYFWIVEKKKLEDRRADLRNKEREVQDLEEKHQVEIKVYKQRVKHLLFEQQDELTHLKTGTTPPPTAPAPRSGRTQPGNATSERDHAQDAPGRAARRQVRAQDGQARAQGHQEGEGGVARGVCERVEAGAPSGAGTVTA